MWRFCLRRLLFIFFFGLPFFRQRQEVPVFDGAENECQFESADDLNNGQVGRLGKERDDCVGWVVCFLIEVILPL
jgi:hypothetical protein